MIITIVCIYYYACIRIQICIIRESARACVCAWEKKKIKKRGELEAAAAAAAAVG